MTNKTKKVNNSFIKVGDTLTLVIDSKPYSVLSSHPNFDEIVVELKKPTINWTKVEDLTDTVKSIFKYSKGKLKVEGNSVIYQTTPVKGVLAERLLHMIKEKEDVTYFTKFLDNLVANPSSRAVTELYGFLERSNLPITEDGCFIAYKGVRADYKDIHSGTMDNSVGTVVKMERNQVDDDSSRTCSHGLHVCSEGYLKSWNHDRTLLCKINPKDVVSIPTDYNHSKMRVCEYEVIAETDKETADLRIINNRSVYRKGLPFAVGMVVEDSVGTKYRVANLAACDGEYPIELVEVDNPAVSEICSRDGRISGYASPSLTVTKIVSLG